MTISRSERPTRNPRRGALLAVAAAAGLAAPAPAMQDAGEGEDGTYRVTINFTGGQLAEACLPGEDDRVQVSRNLICAGYVVGVRDSYALIQDMGAGRRQFCDEGSTSRRDYIEAFQTYVAQHPDMARQPAVYVILAALEWRFPCPQGAAD